MGEIRTSLTPFAEHLLQYCQTDDEHETPRLASVIKLHMCNLAESLLWLSNPPDEFGRLVTETLPRRDLHHQV